MFDSHPAESIKMFGHERTTYTAKAMYYVGRAVIAYVDRPISLTDASIRYGS